MRFCDDPESVNKKKNFQIKNTGLGMLGLMIPQKLKLVQN